MAGKLDDPSNYIRQRVSEMLRAQADAEIDAQETREREEAAQAYAGENPAHFVDFLNDCVKTSVDAMRQIRLQQQECWDVYNEKEPASFARKESWQSRVTVPKPYSTCQFAQAIVRKAFDAEFLSIENAQNEEDALFWQKLMGLMLSRTYSKFPINFTDATGMGFAIGQSMEMIPVWRPGKGLRLILVEPWKIHRDPDALSRHPQSGMYWIHQEDLDYYVLKDGEKSGLYQNVPYLPPGSKWADPSSNPHLTAEEIARRKEMYWQRSRFRSMVRTSEFWGTVLSPKGELLLPNATFTAAGDQVIRKPKTSPYPSLRWPGMGFSPLPHLLRFDGRSLLQGIKSLWHFMNSLFCLHADNLNWIVNPPTEVDVSALVDQTDVDNYPGKQYQTYGTVSGHQAFRVAERRSQTGDILANMNFADQRFQEGTMFTYAAQGLPGYRAEVTAREAGQNLDQSMNVVGLMGKNLEDGALNVIDAAAETVAINISYYELAMLMGVEVANRYADPSSPTGLRLPPLANGTFKVSGISALMRDMEIIRGIREVILPMFSGEFGNIFAPYLKPYQLIRSVEKRLNLRDEGLVVEENTAKSIDKAQQVQQEAAIRVQQAAQAAEATLTEMKAAAEEAKAIMNRAKAEEHRGKGVLAMAKADEALRPEPEPAPESQSGAQK